MAIFPETIGLQDLIDEYQTNELIFESLPEFAFILPLAKGIKQTGCLCGRYKQKEDAQELFNTKALGLTEEEVKHLKTLFSREKLCFGIQTRSSFSIKCY